MAENLITIDDLNNYAPDLDTSSFNTTTTSGIITRASEMVRRYCNVDGFLRTAVTGEKDRANVNTEGELVISLKRRPLTSAADISAIRLSYVDVDVDLELTDGNSQYIPQIIEGRTIIYPSQFIILHGSGLFGLRYSNTFYEIDYTAGYNGVNNVPDDLKEAVTLMVRHLVNRKNNSLGARSFSQGALSINFGDQKGANDMFVSEAKTILDEGGYVRRVIV